MESGRARSRDRQDAQPRAAGHGLEDRLPSADQRIRADADACADGHEGELRARVVQADVPGFRQTTPEQV